jgi:hypothetical protein
VWWRLLLTALLAGHLSGGGGGGSGGGGNVNAPRASVRQGTQAESIASMQADVEACLSGAKIFVKRYAIPMAAGFILLLAWIALWEWLSARLNFVFVDQIVTGTVAIVAPFRRHWDMARSLFYWKYSFSLIGLFLVVGMLLLLGASFITDVRRLDQAASLEPFILGQLLKLVVVAVAFWLVIGIPAALLWVWQLDFVIPMMYARRCRVLAAWRAVLALLGQRPLEALKYLGWRILISMAFGMAIGLAMLAIVMVLILIGILVGFGGVALSEVVPGLKTLLIVCGVTLLVIVVLAFILFAYFAALPPAVWFRIYSLRYLQALNIGYHFFN